MRARGRLLFARASLEAIRRATRRIDPATITNVVAIAPPAYGRGAYRPAEMERVLVTAFTGFRAP